MLRVDATLLALVLTAGMVTHAMAWSDWGLWACALRVEQDRGPDADVHVASSIDVLDDRAGVAMWRAIANRPMLIS